MSPSLQGRAFAKEVEDFGEGYVAVVHADGDRIGSVIKDMPFDRLKGFSEALRSATESAVREALFAASRDWEKMTTLPVRPVVLGGDDLTIILRAEDAIPFTEVFLRAFRTHTKNLLTDRPDGLTASAGIAFVKPSFPYRAAYTLAEELCRAAKKCGGNALMFHRVTTAALRSWDEIRDGELAVKGRSFVGGPWSIDEGTERSLSRLRAFSDLIRSGLVARGNLREWLRLVRDDEGDAERRWKQVLDRLDQDPSGEKQSFRESFTERLNALGTRDTSGWRDDGTTPIHDVLAWYAVAPNVRRFSEVKS